MTVNMILLPQMSLMARLSALLMLKRQIMVKEDLSPIKFANIGPIEVSIFVNSINYRPVDQSLEKMKFLIAVVPEFSPGITIMVVGAIFGMIIVVRRMK
jgi:hypothetical protein